MPEEGAKHDPHQTALFTIQRVLERADLVPQHKLALIEDTLKEYRAGNL